MAHPQRFGHLEVALLLGLHLFEAEELLALQLVELALRGRKGAASATAPPRQRERKGLRFWQRELMLWQRELMLWLEANIVQGSGPAGCRSGGGEKGRRKSSALPAGVNAVAFGSPRQLWGSDSSQTGQALEYLLRRRGGERQEQRKGAEREGGLEG